jgi:hypothetical protein
LAVTAFPATHILFIFFQTNATKMRLIREKDRKLLIQQYKQRGYTKFTEKEGYIKFELDYGGTRTKKLYVCVLLDTDNEPCTLTFPDEGTPLKVHLCSKRVHAQPSRDIHQELESQGRIRGNFFLG